MGYQSKTWSLLVVGVVISAVGLGANLLFFDELLCLVGGFVTGWSIAALKD